MRVERVANEVDALVEPQTTDTKHATVSEPQLLLQPILKLSAILQGLP